ncbi:hypothetical protein HEP87_61340 [Streptomyces sp. S1D4-11]
MCTPAFATACSLTSKRPIAMEDTVQASRSATCRSVRRSSTAPQLGEFTSPHPALRLVAAAEPAEDARTNDRRYTPPKCGRHEAVVIRQGHPYTHPYTVESGEPEPSKTASNTTHQAPPRTQNPLPEPADGGSSPLAGYHRRPYNGGRWMPS